MSGHGDNQFEEPNTYRSLDTSTLDDTFNQSHSAEQAHRNKDLYGQRDSTPQPLQKDNSWGVGLDRPGMYNKNVDIFVQEPEQPLSFGDRPTTEDYEADFALEHDFPPFDDIGGSIDVSQSSLFPQMHDDPHTPPHLPSFFIRPSCYVCDLDGGKAIAEVEKVLRQKHMDIRKPDQWTLACMAYKDSDEISFAVQVWSTDVFQDKCLLEINKRRGDSIFFTHLLCELVHSFPASFNLEPYAEDIAMPMAPEDLPHLPKVEEFDRPVAFTQESLDNLSSLMDSRYLEPRKEALLVLARLSTSPENQNLLSMHENLLVSLRESLDRYNNDTIQRLSLEVWKNMFQNVDHRRHATKEFIDKVVELLDSTELNEVKFLILSCLERIAHSNPSLVFDNPSAVDLFEKNRVGEDERVSGLCQDILNLQLVA